MGSTPEGTTSSTRILDALLSRLDRAHRTINLTDRVRFLEDPAEPPPNPPALLLLGVEVTPEPQFSTNRITLVVHWECYTVGATQHAAIRSALGALDDIARAMGTRVSGERRDLGGLAADCRVQGTAAAPSSQGFGGYVTGTITVTYLGDGA